MFNVDWGDSETLWLNITNALLGLVVVAAVGMLVFTSAYQLVRRWLTRRQLTTRDVTDLLRAAGPHAYLDPKLGLTMADGGEPEPKARKN